MLEFLKKWFTPKEKPVRYTITICENYTGNMRLEGVKRCGKDADLDKDFPRAIYPLILHLATIENERKVCDKCKK